MMNCKIVREQPTFVTRRLIVALVWMSIAANAFVIPSRPQRRVSANPAAVSSSTMRLWSSSSNSTSSSSDNNTTTAEDAMEDLGQAAQSMWETIRDSPKRYQIKQDLIQMGASYDRGFGASPSARQKVNDLVTELQGMNPCEDASVNIDVYGTQEKESPLKGNWRLVWTTAQDVSVLNGSPFTTVGAIFLVMSPPEITSIFDFFPRFQSVLFPPGDRSTLIRAKVKTEASSQKDDPMRIGLTFESVNVKALQVLGQKTGSSLPALAFDLPKSLPGTSTAGESQRYFDVTYLDKDMLITSQDSPGGTNVFVRVSDAEP